MYREKCDITELFLTEREKGGYVTVGAPMVRYSKLEFRTLLRKNKVKLCFTPMIIADSFCQSQEARQNEFTTNKDDCPVIAQFAARNSIDMLTATELVFPYVDGVDLNCGCPQSWAIGKGYGCALLKQPDKLQDILQTLRRNLPSTFSCSIKMRLLQKDSKTSVDMCRRLEACGASFITIHGRTPWNKNSEPVNVQAMLDIKKSIRIPMIVNGDIKSLQDADTLHSMTQSDGVMAARGLLTNPSLFAGNLATTKDCIQDWINLAYEAGDRITFQCFHHHLIFMLEKFMRRRMRLKLNNLSNKVQVFDFINEQFGIAPNRDSVCLGKNTICTYDENLYKIRKSNFAVFEENLGDVGKWNENHDGKYIKEIKNSNLSDDDICENDLDFMGASIFDM